MKQKEHPATSDNQSVRTCGFLGWMLALPLVAQTAPATAVEARLLTPVSSYSSKSGAALSALVATGVCFADGSTLPEGVMVRGTVERVHKVGLGLIRETAGMAFDFTELRLPDGRVFPVEARLRSIDNARERVDSHGAIHGIRATATLSNRAGERLAFLIMGHPAAMLPLFAVETAFFRFPDPEIAYGPGVELHLDVTFPAELGEVGACPDAEPSAEEKASLNDLVAALPAWSYSKRQRQPMDMVNLAFVGSEEQLANAFRAAGWTGSKPNSVGSGFGAMRAIAERNNYADAPMRTLLLDGAEQDLGLQKSLNTFEKRHHLRLWKRPSEFEGRQVWASAATRDIGATFSVHPFGFTHQIEDAVDLERDKVVSDLRFTGCMDAVYYVSRPNLAQAFEGDYRRGVSTDGRVAVVVLNECQSPRLEFAAALPAGPQEPLLVRSIRRVTLTARNHFLRDNWYWRSADGARMAFLALRNWSRERKNDRLAREQRGVILAKAAVAPVPPVAPLPPVAILPPVALVPPAEPLPAMPLGLPMAPLPHQSPAAPVSLLPTMALVAPVAPVTLLPLAASLPPVAPVAVAPPIAPTVPVPTVVPAALVPPTALPPVASVAVAPPIAPMVPVPTVVPAALVPPTTPLPPVASVAVAPPIAPTAPVPTVVPAALVPPTAPLPPVALVPPMAPVPLGPQ